MARSQVKKRFEHDIDVALDCMWNLRKHGKRNFVAYSKTWLENLIRQELTKEGLLYAKEYNGYKWKDIFLDAWKRYKGNRKQIAAAMEVSERTVYRLVKANIPEDEQ